MDAVMGIAMVVGIAPALALMFLGVRNYTYPRVEQPFFSDPTFFMLFVVGLVEGSIVFVAMRILNAASSIILMVLLAVIQILAMVLVMNLRRFRGKSDSVFYGFALGLGNSCGFATGFCFLIYGALTDMDVSIGPSFVVLVLLSVSMSLIMGACGTNVGEGIARHRVMEFALQALLPMVAYDMLLCGAILNGDSLLAPFIQQGVPAGEHQQGQHSGGQVHHPKNQHNAHDHGRHPQQVGHSRNLPPRYVKTSRFSVRGCRSRKRVGRDGCQRFGAARRFGNGSCGGNGSVRYRDSRLRAHLRGGQRAAYRYDAQRQHERHGRRGQHQTTVEGVERLTAQQQFEEKVEDRDAESRLEAVCQKIRCHVICRFVVRCGRSARATRRPR